MADPLLSELCSICHINIPKYRCPGCSTRTCSQQCVQRHKEWAQCSGKRDPTAFVRKSKLGTRAGFDHDYNFITGIELSRGCAEKELENRGLIPDAASLPARSTNEWKARKRIELTRVHVEKAPVGLSRQKLNQTRFTNSKRLLWTVEWIHEDQTNYIGQSLDVNSLTTEYTPIWHRHHGRMVSKKRKREAVPADGKGTDKNHAATDQPNDAIPKVEDEADSATAAILVNEEATPSNSVEAIVNAREVPEASKTPIKTKPETKEEELNDIKPGAADAHGNYFYLVKPHTSGKQKVLVPLTPTDCLLDCLQNQTVLEFPTIQVLSQPPGALPSSFILEDDYLAKFKTEQDEMERFVKEEGPKVEHGKEEGEILEHKLPNAQDILATLQQDIRSGR